MGMSQLQVCMSGNKLRCSVLVGGCGTFNKEKKKSMLLLLSFKLAPPFSPTTKGHIYPALQVILICKIVEAISLYNGQYGYVQ